MGRTGALYVVDMYRELVEHPQFVPEPKLPGETVDFRRWHDRGRIWRIRPKSAPAVAARRPNRVAAEGTTYGRIVALLGNRNAWWRTTAQRLLVERGEFRMNLNLEPSSVPLLRAVLKESPSPLARLHALWSLTRRSVSMKDS